MRSDSSELANRLTRISHETGMNAERNYGSWLNDA